MHAMDWIPRDGDKVWYVVRVLAEVVRTAESKTHVAIAILDGPMKGQLIEAPLEMIHPSK